MPYYSLRAYYSEGMHRTGPQLRLAANLKWLFTELPFRERFDAAAAAGFTAVEYASPYNYAPETVRGWLDQAGLQQVLINTPTDPFGLERFGLACRPDRVVEYRDGIHRALEYAHALDASFVHVLGGLRPVDGTGHDRALATYTANIHWAAEQAATLGVTILLEALNRRDAPGYILNSVEQAADVAIAVGDFHVGVLFDVYHCQVDQGDITRRLETLFPIIRHVQIADAPSRTEPGTGELNWAHVFAVLRRLEYSGWIGCEYTPIAGTLSGLEWRDRFALNP